MTLEDLFTEMIERGWRLNYLRQNAHLWEASILQPAAVGYDVSFASAPDAFTAFSRALEAMPTPRKATPAFIEPRRDLLEDLGLKKPFIRRI